MIEGAIWRRWVFFYFPLTAFIVALLFPSLLSIQSLGHKISYAFN